MIRAYLIATINKPAVWAAGKRDSASPVSADKCFRATV